MKKQILTLFISLIFVAQANALFEIRAGYGVQTPAEDTYSTATLSTMTGLNLDAIVEIPLVPFGFGLRYESMGLDIKDPAGNFKTDMKRTSLLINYRIIDLFAYFGLIGSLGFVNELEVSVPGTATKFDSNLTYSAGVEGGVSLGLIMLGAELGYLSANFKDASNLGNSDLDLSGVYVKALVGVGF